MRLPSLLVPSLLLLLTACTTPASIKPVEYLDDRTAMTVGSLKAPIELVPSVRQTGAMHVITNLTKRTSFAYLGPVEWDKSGSIVYGLWVHIAPGNDHAMADIRAPGTLTMILDSGPRVLVPIDAPQLGRGAYQPVASWGQTAYFELTVELLKQMAVSEKLELDVKSTDDSIVNFSATGNTRETLGDYLHARGITGD
jgi:hypothetical protein